MNTTYKVLFYTEAHWAQRALTAKTPKKALAQARSIAVGDGYWDLAFYNYDKEFIVERIEVIDTDGYAVAEWTHADLTLRLSARDLLDALKQAVQALNAAPRFTVPALDTDSHAIAAVCDRVIAKAKGGAG